MNVAVIEDISGICRYRDGITSTSLFTPVIFKMFTSSIDLLESKKVVNESLSLHIVGSPRAI